jgi:succinate-semialdehyde dehydrogenase/glutarate-semialdehyde dehydrogenase
MSIISIDPTTGQVIRAFSALDPEDMEKKLRWAQDTFNYYRHLSLAQRAEWLNQVAERLDTEAESCGRIITQEIGKPLSAAIAEVRKCAWVCRYYAEQAATFLADERVETDAYCSFICYQPLGILLAVMPWNFPFWQVFRFAAPALMAGNGILLKHASNVPQSALLIESLFQQSGFPPGIFQTLLIGSDQIPALLADDRVVGATLTGSEAAGSSLASLAGQYIKKTVLELGGSDPFIVLESADLEKAATTAVKARMVNNGQSCIAAKRFIVQETVAEDFTQRILEKFQALRVGDPLLPETDLGPLATAAIWQEVQQQVQSLLEEGAQCLLGGTVNLKQPGYFYPPTVLTRIPKHSVVARQEIFGPVALLFVVSDLKEAIEVANDTPFGLGASVWTTVSTEQECLIRELDTGSVFINEMVKSDPRLPFGGIKRSGYGRELGLEGIRAFVNIKTVWIEEK